MIIERGCNFRKSYWKYISTSFFLSDSPSNIVYVSCFSCIFRDKDFNILQSRQTYHKIPPASAWCATYYLIYPSIWRVFFLSSKKNVPTQLKWKERGEEHWSRHFLLFPLTAVHSFYQLQELLVLCLSKSLFPQNFDLLRFLPLQRDSKGTKGNWGIEMCAAFCRNGQRNTRCTFSWEESANVVHGPVI